MTRGKTILAAVLLGAIMSHGLRGDVVTVISHDNDGAVYGSGNFSAQDLIVGSATGNLNYSGVVFFQLPDRRGVDLAAATLTLVYQSAQTKPSTGIHADVWGLGYVTGTPVLNSSWSLAADTETRTGTTLGTNIGSATPTKIADDIHQVGDEITSGATWSDSSATLLNFLNSLYTTYGAQAGDYAVFRINPDADVATLYNSNNGGFADVRFGGSHRVSPDHRATLTLTVVPEPASMSMLALGALALGRRRR